MEAFTDFYGILYGCPAGHRSQNCPIEKIDNLSFKEKIEWYDKLNYKEKDLIQKHHSGCSCTREKKK